MISKQKQRFIDLITSMNNEECSLLLRICNNGTECANSLLASGCCGYSEALKFVEEWEAQHE